MSTDKEIHGNDPSVGMNCNVIRMLVEIKLRSREIQIAKVIDLRLHPVLKISFNSEGWLSGRKRRS